MNLAVLALLWLSNHFIAEDSWFTMMLAYLPEILYGVPTFLLLAAWCFKRNWRMAVSHLALLILFFFASAGLRVNLARPRSEPRFKVLTLNIQRGKQGLNKVLALVQRENPDVFCLQECDSTREEPIVDHIRMALPEYQLTESRGVAIGSRLPVESFRIIALPNGKPLVEARVMWHGQAVTVASVHLIAIFIDQYLFEAPGKIPNHLRKAGAEREEQLQALLTYSSTISNLVLCGDFNAPANAGFHQRLGLRLTDTFASVGSGFGYTIPASFPLMRLDFVYTTHDMYARRCEVLGDVVSDHRAVVAEIGVGDR